jgi:capsid portal protein
MTASPNLDQLTPDQLRALAAQLLTQVDVMGKKIQRIETVNEQLAHEIPPQLMGIVPQNAGGFGSLREAAEIWTLNELEPKAERPPPPL